MQKGAGEGPFCCPFELRGAAHRGDEGASRGAVVVSGWLVRGDSCVESPPRAGYPLVDELAPPAPKAPRCAAASVRLAPERRLRVPGAASGVNPRLPRRATRDGGRG